MRFENADHVIKLDNLIRFMKRETFFCLEQSKDFLRKIFKSFKIEISTEYRREDLIISCENLEKSPRVL